jgi:hypothetical protein
MRVEEVGVDAARSANEARKQRRNEERQPWTTAKVPERAVAVGDSVMPELFRPDHFDLDSARADVFDRVRHETPGSIAGESWVRRRQDGDPHQPLTRKTA